MTLISIHQPIIDEQQLTYQYRLGQCSCCRLVIRSRRELTPFDDTRQPFEHKARPQLCNFE